MNPQLAGAIDLVDDGIEHLDLPPETEYALKVQEAADLLQSAQRELAMSQPQPDEPVVNQLVNQITQATESGLPGMAQRVQPGHQQLGINQQRRVQQALGGQGKGMPPQLAGGPGGMPPQLAGGPRRAGGLPQLPAPNMAGPQMAAQGGIVGYQQGGPPLRPPANVGKNQPIPALLEKYGSEMVMEFLQGEKQLREEAKHVAPEYADDYKQKRDNFYSHYPQGFVKELYEMREGPIGSDGGIMSLRSGGRPIKRYQTEALVRRSNLPYGIGDAYTQEEEYPPREEGGGEIAELTPEERQIMKIALDNMRQDPTQAGTEAGERYKELTGMEDMMADRAKEWEGLQSLREAQFGPKESLRRRWQSGLAQGARQGLGGFGAGVSSEEDKMRAEELSMREASVGNMDKLISDLRALGLGQYQAEEKAQDMVAALQQQGASTAQAVQAALRSTQNSIRQTEASRDIAHIQGMYSVRGAQLAASKNTDMMNQIQILRDGFIRDQGMEPEEAELAALDKYFGQQVKAALARIGVQEIDAEQELIESAMSKAVDSVNSLGSVNLIRAGILNTDGTVRNLDLFMQQVTPLFDKILGEMKAAQTLTGLTGAQTGDDRLERIRAALNRPELTMAEINEGGLTPEELALVADILTQQ
jgi:hypothetical protein